jgi:hypothetical protein
VGGDISRLEGKDGRAAASFWRVGTREKGEQASSSPGRLSGGGCGGRRATDDWRATREGRQMQRRRVGGQAGRRAGGRVGGCLEGLPSPAETHNEQRDGRHHTMAALGQRGKCLAASRSGQRAWALSPPGSARALCCCAQPQRPLLRPPAHDRARLARLHTAPVESICVQRRARIVGVQSGPSRALLEAFPAFRPPCSFHPPLRSIRAPAVLRASWVGRWPRPRDS